MFFMLFTVGFAYFAFVNNLNTQYTSSLQTAERNLSGGLGESLKVTAVLLSSNGDVGFYVNNTGTGSGSANVTMSMVLSSTGSVLECTGKSLAAGACGSQSATFTLCANASCSSTQASPPSSIGVKAGKGSALVDTRYVYAASTTDVVRVVTNFGNAFAATYPSTLASQNSVQANTAQSLTINPATFKWTTIQPSTASVVQSNYASNCNSASCGATYTSSVTVGNTLVYALGWYGQTPPATPTDSRGSTFSLGASNSVSVPTAPALVQKAYTSNCNSQNCGLTYTSSVTSGNTLVYGLGWYGQSPPSAPTDTRGDSFTAGASQSVTYTPPNPALVQSRYTSNCNSASCGLGYTSSVTAGNTLAYGLGWYSGSGPAYVPITITNNQGTATPTTFQQKVTWNPSTYSTYEASDLGNIRFCADTGCVTTLDAWLESCTSSCTTSATSASAWVKLTSAIAGSGGSQTVYMVFKTTTTDFDGNYWGEAPNLSISYGQYDNGANVFGFYDNFAGSTLSNKWTTVGGGSATLALDGSGSGTGSSATSYTISLTTSHANDVLYLSHVNGQSATVSSVTSSPSLTWTHRASVTYSTVASPTNDLETWYAIWSSSGSITITVNLSASVNSAGVAFGVSGANTGSPFDTNGAIPATNRGDAGTSSSVTISTSNANDLLIGAVGVLGNPSLTVGSGTTLVATQAVSTIRETSDEYKIVSSTQSNLALTYSWSGSQDWGSIGDAIKAASGGGCTVTVNNGATFTTASSSSYCFVDSAVQVYPEVAESYMVSQSGNVDPVLGVTTSSSSNSYVMLYNGYAIDDCPAACGGPGLSLSYQLSSGGGGVTSSSESFHAGIWQVTWSATGTQSTSDGQISLTGSDSHATIANYGIYLGQSNIKAGNNVADWGRMRAYPPSNVMPAVSLGGLNTGSNNPPSTPTDTLGDTYTLGVSKSVSPGSTPSIVQQRYTSNCNSASCGLAYTSNVASGNTLVLGLGWYGTLSYVPVTLTNNQGSATPTTFQQKVTWNPSTYSTYEASDLGNIRFCADTACATTLFAWLESCTSSCTTSATSASAWVKLTSAIPGSGGTKTIYMVFQATSIDFDTNYWGEAPNLSGTYGHFDNGANVFNFYDNFAGTTLSNKWTAVKSSGGSVTVSNGATFTTAGTTDYAFVDSATQAYPQVAESYMVSRGGTTDPMLGVTTTSSANNHPALYNGYSVELVRFSGTDYLVMYAEISSGATLGPFNTNGFNAGIWQVIWSGTGVESATDGVNSLSSTDTTATIGNYGIYLGQGANSAGNDVSDWGRMRAYPPSNVMPSVSLGGLTGGVTPTSVTDSLSNTFALGASNSVTSGTSTYLSYIWYATSGSSGADTITATFPISVTGSLSIYELYGVSTATPTASTGGSSAGSTSIAVTSFTPGSNSIVIGNAETAASTSAFTAGTGYSLSGTCTAVYGCGESQTGVGSATTVPLSILLSSPWVEVAISFAPSANTYNSYIWYATAIGGGADTITATFASSVAGSISIYELTGVSTAGPSTSTGTSPTGTTTSSVSSFTPASNSIVIGVSESGSGSSTFTAGTGYALSGACNSVYGCGESQAGVGSATTVPFTLSASTPWVESAISFAPATAVTYYSYMWYATAVSSGADTVTASFTSSVAGSVSIYEFSSLTTTGVMSSTGSSSTSQSSSSVTSFTPATSSVVVGNTEAASTTFTAGSGFTLGGTCASVNGCGEYQAGLGSATTVPMSFSSSGAWVEAAVAFAPMTTTYYSYVWYAPAGSTGADTVSAAFSQSVTGSVYIYELTSVWTTGLVTSTGSSPAGSGAASVSSLTPGGSSIVIGNVETTSTTFSAGSGYTLAGTCSSVYGCSEYQTLVGSATTVPAGLNPSVPWVEAAIAFPGAPVVQSGQQVGGYPAMALPYMKYLAWQVQFTNQDARGRGVTLWPKSLAGIESLIQETVEITPYFIVDGVSLDGTTLIAYNSTEDYVSIPYKATVTVDFGSMTPRSATPDRFDTSNEIAPFTGFFALEGIYSDNTLFGLTVPYPAGMVTQANAQESPGAGGNAVSVSVTCNNPCNFNANSKAYVGWMDSHGKLTTLKTFTMDGSGNIPSGVTFAVPTATIGFYTIIVSDYVNTYFMTFQHV